MDALILFGFLVALAIAAPLWGYDSRDGFTSREYARRQAWWGGDADRRMRVDASPARVAPGSRTPISVIADPPAAEPAAACAGGLALTVL
ncbi:MAG: hypothetical protein M3O34_13735 [Chloroflexota bacterium]|nr:hypothetical protein [Chloroflexota bacterium]